MFINVVYKDAPELSTSCRRASNEPDPASEKTLLVNPNCPVRIMLEYIRKQCKLGTFTVFDLCDESGCLMGLFSLETYAYATDRFEHKRTYYVIVMKSVKNLGLIVDGSLTWDPQVSDVCRRVTNTLRALYRFKHFLPGSDKRSCVLPQLNHDNKLYPELQQRVQQFLLTNNSPLDAISPVTTVKTNSSSFKATSSMKSGIKKKTAKK